MASTGADFQALLDRHIPHSPEAGLYREPTIPRPRLGQALEVLGTAVNRPEVIAAYLPVGFRSHRRAVLFAAERMVWHGASGAIAVRYDHIVQARIVRRRFRGFDLHVMRNEHGATATDQLTIVNKKAATVIQRFLEECVVMSGGHL